MPRRTLTLVIVAQSLVSSELFGGLVFELVEGAVVVNEETGLLREG
jgi:hypothetical protein